MSWGTWSPMEDWSRSGGLSPVLCTLSPPPSQLRRLADASFHCTCSPSFMQSAVALCDTWPPALHVHFKAQLALPLSCTHLRRSLRQFPLKIMMVSTSFFMYYCDMCWSWVKQWMWISTGGCLKVQFSVCHPMWVVPLHLCKWFMVLTTKGQYKHTGSTLKRQAG